MKTTAKIRQPMGKTCGVRERGPQHKGTGRHGRPKNYDGPGNFWETAPRGHGTLDELERKLAAL